VDNPMEEEELDLANILNEEVPEKSQSRALEEDKGGE